MHAIRFYCERTRCVLSVHLCLAAVAGPERRADGAAQALHARRDGARADGAQPVQGAADGAAGGGALDRDDASIARAPRAPGAAQEERLHLELVSRSS